MGRAASLRVYPNPTSGELIVNNEQLTIENIEIYDVVGQCVYTSPSPSKGGEKMPRISPLSEGVGEVNIDVSHLAKGIYFLKVDGKTVKFVKE
jgi:hypothetical protein